MAFEASSVKTFSKMFAVQLFSITLLTADYRFLAEKKALYAALGDLVYFAVGVWQMKRLVKDDSAAGTWAYCIAGALGTYIGTRFF